MARLIALMPVRNEAWILERTLQTLATFCDHIIVADQCSTDGTREILQKFTPKVIFFDNKSNTHSTRIRWRLLEAAREFDGQNFLLYTDADEILSANLLNTDILGYLISLAPGTAISVELVNLWRSPVFWRHDDSVWTGRWMEIGWRDDRSVSYGPLTETLDHNYRIPVVKDVERLESLKLLHFQFVLFERMYAKQRWYRALEAVELGGDQAEAINFYYAVTRNERHLHLEPIESAWTAGWKEIGIDLECFEEAPLYWQEVEILRYFKEYGPAYFAPIDLWDVDWEVKRKLALAQGYGGVPETPIVDPRSPEQRLYHAYLHRFFRTPPWRDPNELYRAPGRWGRHLARFLGLRRHHLEKLGLLKR